MERKGGLLLVFVVLVLSAASANATIVTIDLTGEVTYVDERSSELQNLFHVGDAVTGRYLYDTETPDTNPFPAVGGYVYSGLPYGIFLNVGGIDIQSSPNSADFLISVANNHTGADFYAVISYKNLPLLNGLPVWLISWQLDDYSQTALSSTRIPETPPILEDWEDIWGLRIEFGQRGGLTVGVGVKNVELIPEPATFLLFLLGGLVVLKKPQS
jgi:hypothetical protein